MLMTDEEARDYAVRLNARSWKEVTTELVRAARELVEANKLNGPDACHFGFVVALQRIQVVSAVVDMHGTELEMRRGFSERRPNAPSSAAQCQALNESRKSISPRRDRTDAKRSEGMRRADNGCEVGAPGPHPETRE